MFILYIIYGFSLILFGYILISILLYVFYVYTSYIHTHIHTQIYIYIYTKTIGAHCILEVANLCALEWFLLGVRISRAFAMGLEAIANFDALLEVTAFKT